LSTDIQVPDSNKEITPTDKSLIKFLLSSVFFLFVGTVHGVLQIQPPIRAWLDSIGSPYGGPGHLIDPLAHAHINLIGGVVILCMAVTYYLLPRISGHTLFSQRLVNHTYWWTTLGVCGFYTTLMVFGILEGNLLLQNEMQKMAEVHQIYTPTIAIVSTVMGIGFWIFFANIFMTAKSIYKK